MAGEKILKMRGYEFEAEANKLRNDGVGTWPHQNSRLEVKKHDLQVAVKKPENLKSQIRFEEKTKIGRISQFQQSARNLLKLTFYLARV